MATEETFNSTDPASPGHYGPSQTALLLLDFHTMFVEKIGGPKAVAAMNVSAELRKWAKSQGIVVVHALIDVEATPYPTSKDIGRLSTILTMLTSSGANEPVPLLENHDDNDVHFTRVPGFVSALKSPGLDDFFKKKGIKSLILCGLSTSGCVMRTAITATDEEYVVSVISDGCADRKDDVHNLVIGDILPTRAYVITAAEFQEGYTKAINGK